MIAFNKTNIIHGHFNKCNRNKAVHMTKNGGRIRSEVEDLLGDDSDGNCKIGIIIIEKCTSNKYEMTRNWSNQNRNPALKSEMGNI